MKLCVIRQTVVHILTAAFFLLALFPCRSAASSLTLAWYSNTEDDLGGYVIYYGTRSRDYDRSIDVGGATERTVRNLTPETRYYFALTAYDISGNESDFSAEVSAVTDANESPRAIPDIDGGGGCFIATAAYGSPLDPHINILRSFRDSFLMSSSLGRKCVRLYYQYGPRMATQIEKWEFLRSLTRQCLFPLIGVSLLSIQANAFPAFLLLPLGFFLIFIIVYRPLPHDIR